MKKLSIKSLRKLTTEFICQAEADMLSHPFYDTHTKFNTDKELNFILRNTISSLAYFSNAGDYEIALIALEYGDVLFFHPKKEYINAFIKIACTKAFDENIGTDSILSNDEDSINRYKAFKFYYFSDIDFNNNFDEDNNHKLHVALEEEEVHNLVVHDSHEEMIYDEHLDEEPAKKTPIEFPKKAFNSAELKLLGKIDLD